MLRLLLLLALVQQPQPQNTVWVKDVQDTIAVKQTGPVAVEQDRWVKLATIMTPALITILGLFMGYKSERAREAAHLAALAAQQGREIAERSGKVVRRGMTHITKLVNSQSDAQNERIDQLTAALEKAKKKVPSRARISAREKARSQRASRNHAGNQENGP
jgi:hypothetical protein